jgi:hypothetical protein
VLQVSEGLPLLQVRVNQARQLAQSLRGQGIKPDVADEVTARLKEIARLLGEDVKGAKKGKPARRRQLWKRDPRCFWCGRKTDITTANNSDSATMEHIYHKHHPRRRDTRKVLPSTVLACAKCNHERGAPKVTTSDCCPLVESMKCAA